MARNNHTPEQFETIADELIETAKSLKSIAASMRESGLEHALIHGNITHNTHLPAIVHWVDKAGVDVKAQIRSKLAQIPSSAEISKEKAEKQRDKAAKKPFTPKSTKKNAT